MKTFRLFFTFIAFISLPWVAFASSDSIEQTSFELKVEIRHILLDYYHLQADERNHTVLSGLRQRKADADTVKENFLQRLPSSLNKESSNLEKHWQDFSRLMNENVDELVNSGYPEGQLVLMMRESAKLIERDLDALNELIVKDNELRLPQKVLALRHQKMALLDTIELYGEYSATSTGVPIRTGKQDIAEYCARFEQSLQQLESLNWSKESQHLLRSIRSKWLFIDKTVKRHSEGMVPFLVMRYTDIILKNLDKAQVSL